MASTNKTTHYELSQYIGSDKPTYLVDYNSDMSKIDTGIYNAQGKADNNETAIGTLSNLTTTVKTDLVSAINEVKTVADKVGNLSNLTTSANTDLVSAINEVDAESDSNTSAIGTLANLETTNKTNLVGAINEVKGETNTIGSLSSLNTTDKTSIVNAINEVNSKTDEYSSSETLTNKIFDNKPVYRKVISTGSVATGNSKDYAHSISNLDTIVSLTGMAVSGSTYLPLPFTNVLGLNYQIEIYANATNVSIICGTSTNISSGFIVVEYTKSN